MKKLRQAHPHAREHRNRGVGTGSGQEEKQGQAKLKTSRRVVHIFVIVLLVIDILHAETSRTEHFEKGGLCMCDVVVSNRSTTRRDKPN